MNGGDIKKQAAKKVATAAASTASGSNTAQKKRRKGENLKPIITNDGIPVSDAQHPSPSANLTG